MSRTVGYPLRELLLVSPECIGVVPLPRLLVVHFLSEIHQHHSSLLAIIKFRLMSRCRQVVADHHIHW